MGDTIFFKRWKITRKQKAAAMFCANSVCLAVGGAMFALEQRDWDSWWIMKKMGWALILSGNVFNTLKAFYSNENEDHPKHHEPTAAPTTK